MLRIAFILLTLGVIGLCSWPSSGQQPAAGESPLRLIPDDSILYVHLKGNAFWNNPAFDEVKKRMPAEKWKKLEKEVFEISEQITTIPRRNFESATIMVDSWDVPQVPGFAMLMQSSVPVDSNRFINSVKKYIALKFPFATVAGNTRNADGVVMEQVANIQGKNLYACLIDPKTPAIGDDETLSKIIKRKNNVALTAFASTSGNAELGIGLQISENLHNQLNALMLMGQAGRNMNPADEATFGLGLSIIKAVIDIKQLNINARLLQDFAFDVRVDANSEQAAVRMERLFGSLALTGEFGLQHLQRLAANESNVEIREFRKFFGSLSEACAQSTIKRDGTKVLMTLHSPGGGKEISLAMASIISRMSLMQNRSLRQSNLRQMAIAMHNYHNDYNRLPSAGYYVGGGGMRPQKDVQNSNSKLGLSWRVAILPYLEQDNLFKQFRTNEPWDSEHNKKLIPMMPKIYSMPGVDAGVGLTYYQVFVAPEKPADPQKQRFAPMFTPGRPLTLGQLTVQDGTSNTIMIAEAAKPVIWTKPDDMEILGDDQPLPKLGSVPDEDDLLVAFGDASVRAIKRSLPNAKEYEKLMRQLIGRRDGMYEDTDPIMVEPSRAEGIGTFKPAEPRFENRK
ncbi:MAG: DUF1559 domain-containing protein [Planctomycetia bacterium]|nr:DUF1559 domain-containing protein [Planctomycetia bacterium]